MLICTISDDKLLHVFGFVIMITKLQKRKKRRKISQILQNEMCFHLLHYASKNEKKGHESCQKNIICI